MKLSKINGKRKAVYYIKGYLSPIGKESLENYTAARVKQANKSTDSLYSIFRHIDKNTPYNIRRLNEYIGVVRKGIPYFKKNNSEADGQDLRERLKHELKREYYAHIDTVYQLYLYINCGGNEPDKAKINLLLSCVNKAIETAKVRRNPVYMARSIENQSLRFTAEQGVFVPVTCNLLRRSAISRILSDLKQSVNPMKYPTALLDESLLAKGTTDIFCDLRPPEKGNFRPEEILPALQERKKRYYESAAFTGLSPEEKLIHRFWVGKAYTFLKKEYGSDRGIPSRRLSHTAVCGKTKGHIRNFITSLLLDCGKYVYHFTDSGGHLTTRDLTSYDLEAVSAVETLTRKTAAAVSHASFNFYSCLPSLPRDMQNGKIADNFITEDDFRRLTRHFCGYTYFNKEYMPGQTAQEYRFDIFNAVRTMLAVLRNNHFDLTSFADIDAPGENDLEIIDKLFRQECRLQSDYIYDMLRFNNVFTYYPGDMINRLITLVFDNPYREPPVFVPSFHRIRKELEAIAGYNALLNEMDGGFKTALDFILQSLYYNRYLFSRGYTDFSATVKRLGQQIVSRSEEYAYRDFQYQVNMHLTISALAETLQKEQMQANAKHEDKTCRKGHYPILLRRALAEDLWAFALSDLPFLSRPQKSDAPRPDTKILHKLTDSYLALTNNLQSGEKTLLMAYYVMAKLLSPHELNMLRSDFLKYLQYANDITVRYRADMKSRNTPIRNLFGCAGAVSRGLCEKIIAVLTLCRQASGRVSNELCDYYTDKDDYANILASFVNFPGQSFDDLQKWDVHHIYSRNNNPVLFAQVEHARMYGALGVIEKIYNDKITAADIDAYAGLAKSQTADSVSALSLPPEALKNKIELNNVQKLSALLSDLYSRLLSWAYLWERDLEYFLLGLASLSGNGGISNIRAAFEYTGDCTPSRFNEYKENCPAFEKDMLKHYFLMTWDTRQYSQPKNRMSMRNKINRFDYFRKQDYSLLCYYNYMFDMLSYSHKLHGNVFPCMLKILKDNKIRCESKMLSFTNSSDILHTVQLTPPLLSFKNTYNKKVSVSKKEFGSQNDTYGESTDFLTKPFLEMAYKLITYPE